LIATHPFLDHSGPIPFAHRGGAGPMPENTLAAFGAAVALGYRYLETDVHATADGVLVAFHDDRLDRATDQVGRIAELPWADVREARVAGREPIPRLADLLAAFPAARINIEPKHDAAVGPLVALLREQRALDRVCVGSFSDARVHEVRRALGPAVCTSLGSREVAALRAAAWGLRPFRSRLARRRGRCVQVPVSHLGVPLVDAAMIATAHDLGLPVHVWTVNDPPEMARLLDLGVDGLMTDEPAALRAVLEARDAWPAGAGE
jgi:glycerophosphoryl diester phosphodiesterase